jgi:integrase
LSRSLSRPLTPVELRKLVAACGTDLTGLLGFAGALRRSELVAVEREHIRLTDVGLWLLLPSSKTDAEGKGFEFGIARGKRRETCPVRTLEAWLDAEECPVKLVE